jgi:hypothetical protein
MRKIFIVAAFAITAVSIPALADMLVVNSTPADGFHYGMGNDYSPANAVVLSSADTELALRFHKSGVVAPASDSSGLYSFALGTTPISFDFGIDGNHENASIKLTNFLTGDSVTYNPFGLGNDNFNGSGPLEDTDLFQNSEKLTFGFLSGLHFDPNVNDTYSAMLTAGGKSVTAFAQLGSGAPAVPEPATWAMMLLGFGGIGATMRRRAKTNTTVSYA